MVFFNKQYPKRKRATGRGARLALSTSDQAATAQESPVDSHGEEQELREILTRDLDTETPVEAHEREIADAGHTEQDERITNGICQQAIADMAAHGVHIPPSEASMALKILPKVLWALLFSFFAPCNTYMVTPSIACCPCHKDAR